MARIGLFYATTTGNTRFVAERIQEKLKPHTVELRDVAEVTPDLLTNFDALILGTSTFGEGEPNDDWHAFFIRVDDMDLSGVKVAFFALGDQQVYPDHFAGGMRALYDFALKHGAKPVGAWPTDGYTYDHSEAIVDGQFVGLALDEDNESEKTESRVESWCEKLAQELA